MIKQSRLKELLTYNQESGVFTWNRSVGKATKGCEAGYKSKAGYIQIGLDGDLYFAHRLVFVYLFGECGPSVDHIDGNPSNNKSCNLRLVDQQTNSKNSKKPKSNKSGCAGVSFDDVNRKWRATIKVDRKQIHLGRFTSIGDAIKTRKQAELKYGFHANHGR